LLYVVVLFFGGHLFDGFLVLAATLPDCPARSISLAPQHVQAIIHFFFPPWHASCI